VIDEKPQRLAQRIDKGFDHIFSRIAATRSAAKDLTHFNHLK
jgi:hypothetical protein